MFRLWRRGQGQQKTHSRFQPWVLVKVSVQQAPTASLTTTTTRMTACEPFFNIAKSVYSNPLPGQVPSQTRKGRAMVLRRLFVNQGGAAAPPYHIWLLPKQFPFWTIRASLGRLAAWKLLRFCLQRRMRPSPGAKDAGNSSSFFPSSASSCWRWRCSLRCGKKNPPSACRRKKFRATPSRKRSSPMEKFIPCCRFTSVRRSAARSSSCRSRKASSSTKAICC